MHPNPAFRETPEDTSRACAAERGFGVLAVNAEAGPLLAHVPFLLPQGAGFAELHLVRSNPIARALESPMPAVLAVSGPDSYISPDWYNLDDQVPTWNYVAVHLRGRLSHRPDVELPGLLDRLSASFEQRLLPKAPWTATKMDEGALNRMMRQIVPCRLEIAQIDGTWKLGQNKPDVARRAAADQVADHGLGQEVRQISDLMRAPPKP